VKILHELSNDFWLMLPSYVERMEPFIINLFKGDIKLNEFADMADVEPKSSVSFINDAGETKTFFGTNKGKGSALISITGPVTRYGGMCSYGTQDYTAFIAAANADPDTHSIVLVLDTPGGSVNGTKLLADAIAASNKPVIAHVRGMAASAGMWIASAAKEIYLEGELSSVGSIGTMASWLNLKGYYEKEGAKVVEVYSRLSPDKNKDYRDAENGDYTRVMDQLDYITRSFHSAVKVGRGEKLDLDKENVLTGKMYYAAEALSFGLIDGVLNFEQTIARARELAGAKPNRTREII